MKPNEGRLQTAEHILSHILEHRTPASRVIIAKFTENSGLLEVACAEDLRLTDLAALQAKVNRVIENSLAVKLFNKEP